MREKTLLFGALGATAAMAAFGAYKSTGIASAEPRPNEHRPVRTIQIALFPENARIAVDGQPKEHPNGMLELKGPLGAVFTIEAMANGTRIVERVAVTDIGALPSQIAIPQLPAGYGSLMGDCAIPYYYDANGVKHYKPSCLSAQPQAAEPYAGGAPAVLTTSPPAAGLPAGGRGSLTVVCMPKCDAIVDNDVPLGPGHIFNRPVAAGKHTLHLSAPNGVKKTIVTDVAPDTTKEIRVTLDSSDAKLDPTPSPAATGASGSNEPGFLNLSAYPWAQVSENAKSLCVTPCVKMSMTPGTHTLVLENAERGMRRTVVVTIRSGETTAKSIALE